MAFKLIIYPGRFQPFHQGHKAVYEYLASRAHDVYIATSDKVDPPRSPFSFEEKKKMMELTGMDTDYVVQTKSPYVATEIVQDFNKEHTILFFAVSEKDMAEDPRFTFKAKKDGSPSYFQPGQPDGDQQFETMDKHAYIMTVPTYEFKVLGSPADSATAIRSKFAKIDDKGKKRLIKDLFGNYSDEVFDLMSNKITEAPNSFGPGGGVGDGNNMQRGGVGRDRNRVFGGIDGTIQQALPTLNKLFDDLNDLPEDTRVRRRFYIKFTTLMNKLRTLIDMKLKAGSVDESIQRNKQMKSRKIGTFTKGDQQVGLWEAKGRLIVVDNKSKRVQESSENVHRTVRLMEAKGWVMEVDMEHSARMFKNAAGTIWTLLTNPKGGSRITDDKGGAKEMSQPVEQVAKLLMTKGFEEMSGGADAFDTDELSLEPMTGSNVQEPGQTGMHGRMLNAGVDNAPDEPGEEEICQGARRKKYKFQTKKLKYNI